VNPHPGRGHGTRPALSTNRVVHRLLGAGREVRNIVRSPMRGSFVEPDPDDDVARLDAVAGCEFVDDRIRLE
jgi:hypothetical protein